MDSQNDGSGYLFLSSKLRSPRETLGGYVILPRLIDKVRLKSSGELPPEYHANLLRFPDPEIGLFPLDGRFLEFTGLNPESLERAILDNPDDKAILEWVESNAIHRTPEELESWSRSFDHPPFDPRRAEHRRKNYPNLADRPDLGTISAFDMIDIDEGRLS